MRIPVRILFVILALHPISKLVATKTTSIRLSGTIKSDTSLSLGLCAGPHWWAQKENLETIM